MIKFELKKIYKQKQILITIIVAFLMAMGTFYYAENKINSLYMISPNAPLKIYTNGYFYQLDLGNKENSHLTKEKIEEINLKKAEIDQEYFNARLANQEYFIAHSANLSEKDETTIVNNYNKIHYDYVLKLNALRQEYGIALDKETQKDWDWLLFESAYNVQNNATPHYAIFECAFVNKNPMRVMIRGFEFMFGIAPIVLLIMIFSVSIAKEKENDNLNFLKTQPVSKFKIVFAKWFSIVIIGIIYLFFASLFLFVICKLNGYRWFNGHSEIYRIFTDYSFSHILAYELLIKIMLAFMMMVMFFATIIIIISLIVKDGKTSAVVLTLVIFIVAIITDTNDSLKNIFNPIYLMNIKNILLGYFVDDLSEISLSKQIYYDAIRFYPYLIYGILGLFLLPIASLFLNYKVKIKEKITKNNVESIYKFEIGKIIKETSFKVSVFGVISILLIIGMQFHFGDKKVLINFATTSFLKLNSAIEMRNWHIEHKESWSEEEFKIIIEEHNKNVAKLQKLHDDWLRRYEYYENGDSEKYYSLATGDMEHVRKYYESDKTLPPNYIIEDEHYTLPSYLESEKIYNYLSEKNCKPVKLNGSLLISSYENIKSSYKFYTLDTVSDHSANYIIRRSMNTYSMDLVIISIISLITLGGYAHDKERGNQLELMYTMPVQRRKYHFNKILSSFTVSAILVVMIFVVLYVSGFLSGGLGDINFPIIYYDKYIDHFTLVTKPYFHIIPIWQYTLNLMIILLLQMAFITSLGTLVSIYIKERIKVFAITMSILLLGVGITKLLPKYINMLSPFTYLSANAIADGSIMIYYKLPYFNIWISIVVLLLSTILIAMLGSKIVEKKDIS